MAQDEGRFGRIDPPRRCWAPKPVRPPVPCQRGREFVYVFAAGGASLGRLTPLSWPMAHTEMMRLFRAHVAEAFAGYFILMLRDRAGWHRAKRLTVPENLRLLPQPAHSPDLPPAEPVWKELREKTLPHHSVPALTALEDTLCAGLSQLAAEPARIRSLTDFPSMRGTF